MTVLDASVALRNDDVRLTEHANTGRRIPIGAMLLIGDLLATFIATWPRVSIAAAATFAAAIITGVASQNGYVFRFSTTTGRWVPRLIATLTIAVLPLMLLFGDAVAIEVLHRLPLALVAMVAVRLGTSALVRSTNRRQPASEAAVILGAGTTGAALAKLLTEHREYGIEPLGFVDRVDGRGLPLPVLGGTDAIDEVLETTGAKHLIVAFGVVAETELVTVIRRCHMRSVDVWVIPRFFELGLGAPAHTTEEVWGIPLTRLPRLALRSTQWRVKRMFDLVVSTVVLVTSVPLMLLIALAVRLSSPGPIFFRQTRVGQRGRMVEVLKFRTMRVNDDSNITWSVEDDTRVTAVGRFLRRSCLDEIPQLLNVIRGDMSLVGPRPERPYFVEKFRDEVRGYDDRHRVPVGLTGLAQVNGLRGDTSIEERAIFDNNYIENWTLWSDISILARTALAIVRPAPRRSMPPTIDLRDEAQLTALPSATPVSAVATPTSPEPGAVTIAAS